MPDLVAKFFIIFGILSFSLICGFAITAIISRVQTGRWD